MLKSAGASNLECTQHAMPGRKSLLACALLAMLAGNQAMADVTIDDSTTPIVTDGSSIIVDDGGSNITFIDSNSILMFDAAGNTVVIRPGEGVSVSGSQGTSVIKADGTDSSIAGNLIVEGDLSSTGTFSATSVTANTFTAATVNGATVNSTAIVNSGSITSDTINATTITGGTITGSLNAAGDKITNVAAGTVGTDAVNYDQLSAVQSGYNSRYDELSNQTNARFNYMDKRIDKVEEVANAGIASVAALAAIPSPAHGKRFSVGAGLGNYSSESAVAVGFRAAITESTSMTAGVSRNTASKTAANLGVGYSW